MSTPILHSIADTGNIIGIRHSKLYELIALGRLAAVKQGSRTMVTHESIVAYVASLPPADIKTGLARRAKEKATAA